MVAWNTAALYPERVERLIIMAVPHPIAWTDNLDLDQRRRWGWQSWKGYIVHQFCTCSQSLLPACCAVWRKRRRSTVLHTKKGLTRISWTDWVCFAICSI